MSGADRLERDAQRFADTILAICGRDHPLRSIFAGLMMVYYTDEADLQWVNMALRPWFEDSEEKSELQEREILIAMMWISSAFHHSKRLEKRY